MSEEPQPAEPAVGAMWFPDEGGIMWRGKAYLPEDYVFTHNDITRVKADAWLEGHHAGRLYQGDGWNCDAHDPDEDNPYRTVKDN